jgi:predicted kinase
VFCRETAEENQCFNGRFPFFNDETRLAFFRISDASIHQRLYDFREFTATMMCGLPGSGKSTWIGKELGGSWKPVIELDQIRHEMGFSKHTKDEEGQVQQAAKERLRDVLAGKKDFYYDAVNLSKQVRQRLIRLFLRYGAKIRIVHLDIRLETVLEQNRGRERPVPEGLILNMARQMQPPRFDECHELVQAYMSRK